MKLRSRTIKSDDDDTSRRTDKSRVTKRKSPVPRTPLAAAEQTLKSKRLIYLQQKFRWTEKRDRTLLIHLIGFGGVITDEEYAKLAALWKGATADDVHARVEFLRAQQILTIRTEETAEAAAEAYPESAQADNVDHVANIEESVSEETSSSLSPSSSLDHGALPPPPPSPTSPSSPSSATCDDEDDDDNNNDNDSDSDNAQPALKPALKSRGSTTAIPGSKLVRFASPIIATVREIPFPPRSHRLRTGEPKKVRRWFPVETAPWEDEMFSTEDASDSASASSSSSRRRKRATADDDDDLARPAKRRRSTSTTTVADDDDDDNDNEEEETEVPYPLSQTARSPRVPRTRAGSHLTASNVHFTDDMSPDSPRGFRNNKVTWPKPVRTIAAVAESQEWQEESEDEGETAVIDREKRFSSHEGPISHVHFTGGAPVPAATVQPDFGWNEPDMPDRGGLWEYEGEGESEEDYSVEDGDVGDMVAEAEGLVEGRERSFQPAQPIYDNTQSSWRYQQVGGGVPAPFYGEQSTGPEYGNFAGGWYPSEAPQEELVDDGSAGQQYTYPPPPVDDGGNTPYPGIGSASPAWVGYDEVAEHPQQQQQYVEESEEVEDRDADDEYHEWSYFNQLDDASIWPTSP